MDNPIDNLNDTYLLIIYSCQKNLSDAIKLYEFLINSSIQKCKIYIIYGDLDLETEYKFITETKTKTKSKTVNDIAIQYIILKVADDYYSLNAKTISLLKMVNKEFPTIKGMFKMDDDVVPNIKHLNGFILGSEINNIDYCGYYVNNPEEFLYNFNNETRYSNTIFPVVQYSGGPLYYLSNRAIRLFDESVLANNKIVMHIAEDIMVGKYLNENGIYPSEYKLYENDMKFCRQISVHNHKKIYHSYFKTTETNKTIKTIKKLDIKLYSSNVSLVTCFYKFKSKHTFEEYNYWIKNLLTNIYCNIIIFTSNDLAEFLEDLATSNGNKNVYIITKEFDDLEINKKYKKIWDEQHRIDPTPKIRTKECYIIWNSKMQFVKEAIEINPFNSEKFIWNDIGSMRDDAFCNQLAKYPLENRISNDKMDIVIIQEFDDRDYKKKYFQNMVRLSGSIFGAHKTIFLQIIDLYYKYFDEYLKKRLFIGCDQQILATLYICLPHLFNLIRPEIDIIDKWFYLYYHYSIDNNIDNSID